MEATPDCETRRAPWRFLMDEAGARLEHDCVVGLPPADAAASMVPLLDRAWLRVTGGDARQFLHDQLTAGVVDVTDAEWRMAAYCSPQGRVLALLRITGDGEQGLLVELPAALADGIASRLRMFVLRADVCIEHADGMAALGCWGNGAGNLLTGIHPSLPERPFQRTGRGGCMLVRLPGPAPRFQLTGPASTVTEAWRRWAGAAAPANTADWRYLDVWSGLPDILPATADQFLPQSLGLEHWEALSYRKGCFPGQEVIARAHYRGRLKRHLYRARAEGAPPEPGDTVLDAKDGSAGSIVTAAPDPAGGALLLAVLHERAEAGCRLERGDRNRLDALERVAA